MKKNIYKITIENAIIEVMYSAGTKPANDNLTYMTLHTHGYGELFAVESGTVTVNNSVILQEHDVALVPKNLKHKKTGESENASFFTVCISLSKYGKYQNEDIYSRLYNILNGKEIKRFQNEARLYDCLCNFRKSGSVAICELVGLLLEESCSDIYTKSEEIPDVNLIYNLEMIIYNEFMCDLSMNYVAQKLGISTRQLTRITEKRYGNSLHRTVINKRIETAKKMLKETDCSVAEISDKVGFKNTNSLYAAFKKSENTTPSKYRQSLRKT